MNVALVPILTAHLTYQQYWMYTFLAGPHAHKQCSTYTFPYTHIWLVPTPINNVQLTPSHTHTSGWSPRPSTMLNLHHPIHTHQPGPRAHQQRSKYTFRKCTPSRPGSRAPSSMLNLHLPKIHTPPRPGSRAHQQYSTYNFPYIHVSLVP